jgi:hypothetical protein
MAPKREPSMAHLRLREVREESVSLEEIRRRIDLKKEKARDAAVVKVPP